MRTFILSVFMLTIMAAAAHAAPAGDLTLYCVESVGVAVGGTAVGTPQTCVYGPM